MCTLAQEDQVVAIHDSMFGQQIKFDTVPPPAQDEIEAITG